MSRRTEVKRHDVIDDIVDRSLPKGSDHLDRVCLRNALSRKSQAELHKILADLPEQKQRPRHLAWVVQRMLEKVRGFVRRSTSGTTTHEHKTNPD